MENVGKNVCIQKYYSIIHIDGIVIGINFQTLLNTIKLNNELKTKYPSINDVSMKMHKTPYYLYKAYVSII